MPELHDVEHFRRTALHHAAGKRIEAVDVHSGSAFKNARVDELRQAIVGRELRAADRFGTWLVLRTDEPSLVFQFGASGELVWSPLGETTLADDRVALGFAGGGELRFRTPRARARENGGVWLARDMASERAIIGPLGPDALSLTRREFHRALGAQTGAVKLVLFDQAVVAGIGDTIADEALWQAGIHPLERIDQLTGARRDRLFEALRRVMLQWVGHYGVDLSRWLTHVRGTPDATCPRCRTRLTTVRAEASAPPGAARARATAGGGASFVCPTCQKAPGALAA
jgi:formamidopyrimidine-DNA glycosylase